MEPAVWILDWGRIRLRTTSGELDVPAAEVVAVEFKGRTSVRGHPATPKPSDSIVGVEFNRFPLEPWMVLRAPASGQGSECATSILRSRDNDIDVESFARDTTRLSSRIPGYPIASGVMSGIRRAAYRSGVAPGPITLRQYLLLAQSNPPRVVFEEALDTTPVAIEAEPGPSATVFKGTLYPYQTIGVRLD